MLAAAASRQRAPVHAFIVRVQTFLQYRRQGLFSDERWGFPGGGYMFGERMFQVQSLVSKSLLLWLVVGGANQPNAYTKNEIN